MKPIIVILSILVFTGCAHKTLHERCSEAGEAERYGGIEQCMSEKQSDDIARQARAQAITNSFNNSMSPKTVSCTSKNVGYATKTNCQ